MIAQSAMDRPAVQKPYDVHPVPQLVYYLEDKETILRGNPTSVTAEKASLVYQGEALIEGGLDTTDGPTTALGKSSGMKLASLHLWMMLSRLAVYLHDSRYGTLTNRLLRLAKSLAFAQGRTNTLFTSKGARG